MTLPENQQLSPTERITYTRLLAARNKEKLYFNCFRRLPCGFECIKCGAVKKDKWTADDHMDKCFQIGELA